MNPKNPIQPTVYVVDDDLQMRTSLLALLQAMKLPALAFPSGESFRQFYEASMPGCLVLDIKMPIQDGLELYEQLIQDDKRLPVIFITGHADVSTAVAAMKTGAIEFLEKPFERENLLHHIRKALVLDAHWRGRDAEYREYDARLRRLTPRELETLQLILAGNPNKVMAARLHISERAVEMRRAAIMQKMNTRSLAELLEMAISHRILGEIQNARGNAWLHV